MKSRADLPVLDRNRSDIKWLWDRTLFLTKHGSHAYGTATPTSDLDLKGFCVPPKAYFLGYAKNFEQAEFKGDPDMVVYGIQKFFKLAADCNPSVIEVLFTDPAEHVILTDIGRMVLDKREMFLSRKAKHTFSGYAASQLKKIGIHYKWIHNPPKKAPERKDFGLPETGGLLDRTHLEAAEAVIKLKLQSWDVDMTMLDDAGRIALQTEIARSLAEQQITADAQWAAAARSIGLSENFIYLATQERAFGTAVAQWRSYQNWLVTRNPKRSELEKKWGYDTKHGMHLVRLMRMGAEILRGEGVKVKRPDREELLAIRNGLWTYEELLLWAKAAELDMEILYKTSPLPNTPPVLALDNLLVSVVESSL